MIKPIKLILKAIRMIIAIPFMVVMAMIFLTIAFFAMLIPVSRWIGQGIEEWNELI
jgi:phosphotransferase system  glucose/maltose/N-acetylglucosamine-specific IIC component